jgi:hypothetical protein
MIFSRSRSARVAGLLMVVLGSCASHAAFAADENKAPVFKARKIDDPLETMGPRYSLAVGMVKPAFSQISYYEDMYGNTAYSPDLRVTYDLLRLPWIALQGGMGVSYYSDRGYSVKYPDTAGAPLEKTDHRLLLSHIPYRFMLGMQLSPFDTRYLAFGGWVGYEELFFSETRSSDDVGSTKSATTNSSDDSGEFINTGWNAAMVYGAALHINVGWVEEKNVRSLQNTMDFSQIYISPFYEASVALSQGNTFISRKEVSPVNFERQSFGLAFTFSTAR